MTFQGFKPAVREAVPLLLGLVGGTGSGKTYTAMRLATGIAKGARFAVIDTEAGRAKHYADRFAFDHGDLKPPFTPEAYTEAIVAADKAGYPVIVVDSMSHVWAGDGGVLDWQEAELTRMAGDDWKRRDACLMASWIKPKMAHKHMVAKLLQVRAHLILCFRAEPKVEMQKDEKGRTVVVPKKTLTGADGWVPVCEKNLPFELTTSLLMLASNPGVAVRIKVEAQHEGIFLTGSPVTEDAGAKIAAWAAGGAAPVAQSETSPALHAWEGKIAAAETMEMLNNVKAQLNEQRATLSGRERAWLRDAIEKRTAELRPPAETAADAMTEERVQMMIDTATNATAVDIATGFIEAVPDEAARARLDVNARAKKRTLNAGATS